MLALELASAVVQTVKTLDIAHIIVALLQGPVLSSPIAELDCGLWDLHVVGQAARSVAVSFESNVATVDVELDSETITAALGLKVLGINSGALAVVDVCRQITWKETLISTWDVINDDERLNLPPLIPKSPLMASPMLGDSV